MPTLSPHWDDLQGFLQAALESPEAPPLALLHLHLRRHRSLRARLGEGVLSVLTERSVQRVWRVLRAEDRVLRLGESDLLIALPGMLSAGHARLAAQALQRSLLEPIHIDELSLRLQPEIGLAMAPLHGSDPARLQRAASSAAEQARSAAGGIAEATGAPPPLLYSELAHDLRANALAVEFQPIVRLSDGQRVGYEALARWRHPQSGEAVPPALFVVQAEEAGLVAELTRWSLQAALREFAPLYANDPRLHCALNLSALAFGDSGLVEQIESALAIWGLPPSALLLEITETALLDEPRRNARQLSRLRALGIGVAIDDFGQGHSSFGYLQFLELSTLKIDRRFLQRIDGERDRGLLQSMIELAHRLNMEVVAEGVETFDVARALKELGCDCAQGWHFGYPSPAAHWLGGGR
jgi:EAL domain-containing protein (putative c-di-GMP-specific phosphodiesterase class I)/GGDEF domain-containing protein